jgi:nitrite reductase (cytochrome c-552)
MESLHNRVQGKTRKAEYWLTRLIDKFEEAKNLGVADNLLNQVREKHTVAHMHWEWWTASNGHAFHNPDAATESLAKSVVNSQEGIKLLDDAMAGLRKKSATAAPVAVPVAGTPGPR